MIGRTLNWIFAFVVAFAWQVTTSSQRDQDDDRDLVIVDSESDEEMPDDGPVEPDDTIQFEDETDNVETFEEEAQGNILCVQLKLFAWMSEQQWIYDIRFTSGESTDMYAETDNNEVDVDESSEPNESNPNASTSSAVVVRSEDEQENVENNPTQPQDAQAQQQQQQQPQQQAISASDSGSSTPSTPSTWRVQTASRLQPVQVRQHLFQMKGSSRWNSHFSIKCTHSHSIIRLSIFGTALKFTKNPDYRLQLISIWMRSIFGKF